MNTEVTSSDEGGFSRRRVMKGVAWTVPVIVTAVGAPPASASPGPTDASGTWGNVGASTATGSVGSLAVQAPTTFDIKTGTGFKETSLTYTITIPSLGSQKSLIEIASASPGTGTSTVGKGGKNTTFTGTLTTTPGNHNLHVVLGGFKYTTKPNKTGLHTYTMTLTVSGTTISTSSSLSITFP
ncbi:hypothetical protein [Pseudarthrobacter sp. TAF60_1]|uniref:hypothetical protein n=1 Tax=Pseudarthrobacter sp. TAF60_1 TaxID=3233071 RepID=UPI003F952384